MSAEKNFTPMENTNRRKEIVSSVKTRKSQGVGRHWQDKYLYSVLLPEGGNYSRGEGNNLSLPIMGGIYTGNYRRRGRELSLPGRL